MSTLASAAGSYGRQSGEVLVNGRRDRLERYKRIMGFVPQVGPARMQWLPTRLPVSPPACLPVPDHHHAPGLRWCQLGRPQHQAPEAPQASMPVPSAPELFQTLPAG